jgi:hypothetical protein
MVLVTMPKDNPIESKQKDKLTDSICRAWFGSSEHQSVKAINGQVTVEFEHQLQDSLEFRVLVEGESEFERQDWNDQLRKAGTEFGRLVDIIREFLAENFNYDSNLEFYKSPYAAPFPIYEAEVKTSSLKVDRLVVDG